MRVGRRQRGEEGLDVVAAFNGLDSPAGPPRARARCSAASITARLRSSTAGSVCWLCAGRSASLAWALAARRSSFSRASRSTRKRWKA
jgi:hypothetical protein